MEKKLINWLIFSALSIIWGSSFILMKEGMVGLTAYQVASIRILSSGLVLLPVTVRFWREIPLEKLFPLFMSGVLGNLLPAYLFCIAEEKVDSALAGTLNSLTPIFVILIGALFFSIPATFNKIAGILVAFAGSILLFINQPGFANDSHALHILFIVIATIFYGINVNMVYRYLQGIPPLHMAAVGLSLCMIPALIVLILTGFFKMDFQSADFLPSVGYSVILGVMGTALSSVLFYRLIKNAGTTFSSMVTYCIPIVANVWGILYGEQIGWLHFICLGLILAGVYITNLKRSLGSFIK